MGLLNYKTVIVLLFVVIINAAIAVLLWRIDSFIHVDLYNYGLIFSLDWAEMYWHTNMVCWIFIFGATAFAISAAIPHYVLSRKEAPSELSVMISVLLSGLALGCEAVIIFFLYQIDSIVRNTLYDFGLSSNLDWLATYEPLIAITYGLMAISMALLIIPALRSLGIKEVKTANLLRYKFVIVLLFVVIINAAIAVLLWRIDSFIHVDLYNYGLIFSLDWAEIYWLNNLSTWTFIVAATAFTTLAVIPQYLLSRKDKHRRLLVIIAFLLPAIALACELVSFFYIYQIDFVVRKSLYDFGLSSNLDWLATYEPLIAITYGLMAISMVMLLIPALRSLGAVESETVEESD